MFRRLGLALAVLLVSAPAASAAAPSPYAVQGGDGVASRDGALHYVAQKAGGGRTTIQVVRQRDGEVLKSRTIDGAFGIPMVSNAQADGIFHDGTAFVLQSLGYGAHTDLRVVDTSDLSVRDTISLTGTYAYDALSPNGKTLYLIEHRSTADLDHYIVRAYDLQSHTLRPGRIADKAQKSWVMQGFPATRASTKSGRWVYTLYMNPSNYPFVHALDTVKGVAHCVGIAWPSGDQGEIFSYRLAVKGSKLQVRTPGGFLYRAIDLRSWKVTKR
jgi:hypothetical protein